MATDDTRDHDHMDKELARTTTSVLSSAAPAQRSLTVRMLEHELSSAFLPDDAEPWDRTGLVVGDPSQGVEAVAVALDPTVYAVRAARDLGCNVLVTHHPPFIDPPDQFAPLGSGSCGAQLAIWQAIRDNVALMCYHTALDANPAAHKVLPSMLGLLFERVLEPRGFDPDKGYGQVCVPAQADAPMSLEQLAARCMAVFGRLPRVWGSPSAKMGRIVTATGSGGSLIQRCLDAGCDCLVCGEVRYHDALHAAEAGLAIIELGHDVSELPLCAVIAAALEACGLQKSLIKLVDQSGNWWTPEATRR